MNRRFMVVPIVLSLMVGAWLMMPQSAKAQAAPEVHVTIDMADELVADMEDSGVYTTTADYIPVCFSPCNLFFSASQPVTWTIAVNGATTIVPPRQALTSTLHADAGEYRITYSAEFRKGPTQQSEFKVLIILPPSPMENEITCLATGSCTIPLTFTAPWPTGIKSFLDVKTSGVLYDRYFFTSDRKTLLIMVITGTTARRIPVGISLFNKYTIANITTTVNVVGLKISVKLPIINTAPAVSQ